MCEYILHAYAKESKTKYAMVRFTHIIDNSLMDQELDAASKHDEYIAVHSPGKYVTAQNVTVVILGDAASEADETFNLNLSGVSNALAPVTPAVGKLLNDFRRRLRTGTQKVEDGPTRFVGERFPDLILIHGASRRW